MLKSTCLLLLLLGTATAFSTPDTPISEEAEIEPLADRVLKEMCALLESADAFTVHNEFTSDESATTGELVQLGASVDIAIRRPDRIRAVVRGDYGPKDYWFDGKRIGLMDGAAGTYATAPVQPTIDAALNEMWEKFGLKIPLADFICASPYDDLTANVQYGFYAGLHEVRGVGCHHLVFSQEDIDWQIWIEDGLRPLPRKLLISYKQDYGAPRYTAEFSDWDLSPGLGDTVFQFVPAEDLMEIEFAERTK